MCRGHWSCTKIVSVLLTQFAQKQATISRGRDGTPDAYKTLFLAFETLNAELQTARFSALLLTENAVAFSACSPGERCSQQPKDSHC